MVATVEYEDIARHVTVSSLRRGTTYYRRGAVLEVRLEDDRTVSGMVMGSSFNAYETRFTAGEEGIQKSECSCPLGGSCKHVAALAMEALETLGGGINGKLVLEKDDRPVWERSVAELVDGREGGDVAEKPYELLIAVRIWENKLQSYWQTAVSDDRVVQLRPRVLDKASGRTSFRVSWPVGTMFGYARVAEDDLTVEQSGFLEELTNALSSGYGSLRNWTVVSDERAAAFWQVMKRVGEAGVKLVYELGESEIAVEEEAVERELVIDDAAGGDATVKAALIKNDEELDPARVILLGSPPWCIVLMSEDSPQVPLAIHPVVNKGGNMLADGSSIVIPRDEIRRFQSHYVASLAQRYGIRTRTERVVIPQIGRPKAAVKMGKLRGKVPGVTVRLGFSYDNKWLGLKHDQAEIGSRGRPVVADRKKEKELTEVLGGELAGLLPARDEHGELREQFALRGMAAAGFMKQFVPRLEKHEEIEVRVADNVPEFEQDWSDPEVSFAVNEAGDNPDWFDLNITVKMSGEEVPFVDLFEALAEDKEHLMLPSGRYFILNHPAFIKLRELIKESGSLREADKGGLTISRYQTDYWQELVKLGVVDKQAEKWRQQMQKLSQAKMIKYKPPRRLLAELRDYQLEGYSWLRFLYNSRMGGILADDMGLGKTVQMIAMVVARPSQSGPVLVAAPTSVVEVWEDEVVKFAPHLRTVVMRSGDREEAYARAREADMVITSYALLWRDFDRLKQFEFDVLVLDEAQAIKNHQSKIYATVRQLRTGPVFALTGTPMENSVMELWSISSVASPGLFGKPDHFREHFQRPIEKMGDGESLAKLRARIRPFMMRRKKEQVASELPMKTVQTLHLDLDDKHRRVYDLHLQRERKKVLGLLAEGGLQAHRFAILKSITRMRQMALHPGLVDGRQKGVPNAKLEETVRQVEELTKEGHKALVFSQFTSFLSYLREVLDRRGVEYLYLDGRTRRRGELVKRFQDPAAKAKVFVISLKAGGVGVTLTAADYCFILDPWWNPAVEQQAVDRTHRLGQDKHVHVYKMIGKGTIEEKVLALQQKKEQLFRDVIEGEGEFAKGVTEDDIRMLVE